MQTPAMFQRSCCPMLAALLRLWLLQSSVRQNGSLHNRCMRNFLQKVLEVLRGSSACCFAAPRTLQSFSDGTVTHGCFSFAFAGQVSVGPFACAAQVSARFVVCLFACLFYVVCVTFRCDVWLWFVLSVLACCVGLCVTVRCEVWSWFVLSALVCCALACGAVCSGTISWACSQEMLANVPSPSGRARNYYYYYRYCYNYDDEEKEEDGVYRYY